MVTGQTSVGNSVSITVTVKLQVAVLPDVSVARQLTVVVPLGKIEPGDGLQTEETPEQLSVAVTEKLTVASHREPAVFTTMFEGQMMVGGTISSPTTFTEKLQLFVRPAVSVAKQLTTVVPFWKIEPEGGLHTTVTPGQLSVAVTI